MPSLLDRAKRFVSRRREEVVRHAVDHSRVDEAVLTDTRRRASTLDSALSDAPSAAAAEPWERLGEDAFYAYFGRNEPRIRSRDEIDPTYAVNRAVMDRYTREEGFTKRHPKTRSKPDLSALGAMGALESLRDSYEQELREHVERQEEMATVDETLDSIDEQMEQARREREQHVADEDGLEDLEAADDAIRELAEQKREALHAKGALVVAQAGAAVELGEAAGKAVTRAVAAADEAIEQAQLVPGIGKDMGAGTRIDPDLAFKLAQRTAGNPVLRAILETMGKLKLDMGTKRRKLRKGGYDEIVDIELGDDLRSVLPQEKLLIRHPVARREFYRRYLEKSLTQYETWSEQELKRGPVVNVIDGSLSMDGPKNHYARGLALAAIDIANGEGRNAAAVEFGGPDQTQTWIFPKGKGLDPETCVEFAEHFFAGGTSILSGLREAMRIIAQEAPFHEADVVIYTDGEDRWTPEDEALVAELEAMGVRVHGIALGIAPTNYLLRACEQTTSVYDFAVPNAGSDRLAVALT